MLVPNRSRAFADIVDRPLTCVMAQPTLVAALVLLRAAAAQKTYVRFDKPGSHSWTVPPCVTSLNVLVVAGGGGGGGPSSGNNAIRTTPFPGVTIHLLRVAAPGTQLFAAAPLRLCLARR